MTIAVLMATYNRREKTLACLRNLFAQRGVEDLELEVFLTDDASRDDTVAAVAAAYPAVHVFAGTGSLFWAGGMRHSWRKALYHRYYDYFLLLNDDSMLFPEALAVLLKTASTFPSPALCIGSTSDEITGRVTYGGRRLLSRVTMKDELIAGNDKPVSCDLGNGNIMLVPASVVSKISILSDEYTHGLADWDYTLRAKENGFGVLVAPGILGHCANDHVDKWSPAGTPLRQRVRHLYHHKGMAYREYLYFLRTHFRRTYFVGAAKLWIRTLFPMLF